MNTSNFAKSGSHPKAVAICRYTPKGFRGRWCPKLAPSPELLRLAKADITDEQWRVMFERQVLAKLDPHVVARELGEDAVLLCYEKYGDPCHRHLVADWLRKAGYEITEIGAEKSCAHKKPDAHQTKQQFFLF